MRESEMRWREREERIGGGASRSSDLVLSLASRLSRDGMLMSVVRIIYDRHADDESRRDRWKAPGSEVSTFLFEKKKIMKMLIKKKCLFLTLSINIIQPLVLVHTGLTRTRTFNYTYAKNYTHERLLHTEQKKKKRETL